MCVHACTRFSSWESVGPLIDMGMDLIEIRILRCTTTMTEFLVRRCHEVNIFIGNIPLWCPAAAMRASYNHTSKKTTYSISNKHHKTSNIYSRSRAIHDKLHFSLWFPNDVLRCVAQWSQSSMPVGFIFWINFGNLLLEFFVRNTVCAFVILQSIRIHSVSFAMRNENYFLAGRRS